MWVMVDDLDGSPGASEVTFSLDGVEYVIHLSAANRRRLLDVLEPFLRGARRASTDRRRLHPGSNPPAGTQRNAREWAESKGMNVNKDGRVPNSLIKKYLDDKPSSLVPVFTPAVK